MMIASKHLHYIISQAHDVHPTTSCLETNTASLASKNFIIDSKHALNREQIKQCYANPRHHSVQIHFGRLPIADNSHTSRRVFDSRALGRHILYALVTQKCANTKSHNPAS